MCKIAVFTNAKKLSIKDTVNKAGNILLKTEIHGFGYAAQGKDGVFGEKCVDKYFKTRLGTVNNIPKNIIKQKYSMFGKQSELVGSLIMHGRISTNDLGITNCHPMIRDNHYLIHNGVVTDDDAKYDRITTNDSEDLLYRFIQGIQAIEENIWGYYAFAVIDPQGFLHIVKDNQADLHIAWLDKFDTYLIGTTPELIKSIAHSLGTKSGPIDVLDDNKHMIFKGNDLQYVNNIKPLGYQYYHESWSQQSLGKIIDKYTGPLDDLESCKTVDHSSTGTRNNEYSYEGKYFENDAEQAFWDALEEIDDTYYIFDKHGNQISLFEFDNMLWVEQRKCLIETPDGRLIEYISPKAG